MNNRSLVDSNILIYAHDTDSPFFKPSQSFIKKQIEAGTICFSLQVITESYRIWTQKLKKPITPEEAWKIKDYYIRINVPVITPSTKALVILKSLTIRYGVRGVYVFDALLVATMIEHGIEVLYTANIRDFKQYKEIKTVNPLEK